MSNSCWHRFVLITCLALANKVGGAAVKVQPGETPYVTYLYYRDEQIKESNNESFFRVGVLVSPQHVLSASIDPVGEGGFPWAAMVARAGAVTVSAALRPYLHDGEQEREVQQIIKPQNHLVKSWWNTDITMVKLLEPFTVCDAVAPAQLAATPPLAPGSQVEGKCSILVYEKMHARSKKRSLRRVNVTITTIAQYGESFQMQRLLCYIARDQREDPAADCYVNTGSPLLCGGDVVALRMYTNYFCKCQSPYMYQRLYYWEEFINYSLKDEYHKDITTNAMALYRNRRSKITRRFYVRKTVTVTKITTTTTITNKRVGEKCVSCPQNTGWPQVPTVCVISDCPPIVSQTTKTTYQVSYGYIQVTQATMNGRFMCCGIF